MGNLVHTPHRPFGELRPLTAALALGLGLSLAPTTYAATFTVTTLADSGGGSLRAAIASANGAAGADTVNFQAGLSGTITLTTGEIAITDDLTITGPGASVITITKSGAAGRLLDINVGTPTVTISGLTFTGGDPATAGGAIAKTGGSLTIQSSVFTNNQTTGTFAGGGALYSAAGSLTIQNSVFSGNTGAGGGALYHSNSAGALLIQNSTFSGNTARRAGGALYATSGNVTIQSSTFSGNTAGRAGGALYSRDNLVIQNSTFSGNSATGDGGAIFLYGGSTATISNSTITGNSTATGEGGAIILYNDTLNLASTIVANNTDKNGANEFFDLGNSTVNATNSLIQVTTGFTFGTNTANIIGQNPLLGPLANNGGPTQTHALLAGSPAIDKGSNPLALSFDQRGTGFARTVGAQTDIGAFEVQGSGPPPPPPPPPQIPIPTLSQWGTVALSALLGAWALVTGFGRRRRPKDYQ
ncbi:MAG TPA: IPTL-CTERM sorting domain-containing protein [Casimicrobiaceae bacterium]|nr:IPTL-CTERM sorting domain-containing protein [Casimicrobiaceae bacterium]